MRVIHDYDKNLRAAARFRRMTDETSQHIEGMPQPCWLWQGTFDSTNAVSTIFDSDQSVL